MSRSGLLLCGVSGIALAVSAPAALATDLPARPVMVTKAPVLVKDTWSWFVEGGAQHVGGGDPFIAGMNNPPFSVMPRAWGWQGAVGVDYHPGASPYHFSAQFRYGNNGSNSKASTQTATIGAVTVAGPNSADRKEHNWAADFMVGRDLGLGQPLQVKVGLRIAQIWGQTNGVASWTLAPPTPPTQTHTYQQTDRFLGFGPRVAIEGSVPFASGWSFDYNGGVAGLFGRSTADQTDSVAITFGGGGACTAGCPLTTSSSNNNFVFNADVQGGIAYAVTRDVKVSVNYRAEGYWNSLRSFDSANNGTNLTRIYHGPTAKLTVAY